MRDCHAPALIRRRIASRGRSLVEIMIALVLSLLLLGSITALYLTTQRSTRTQEGLRSADDGARWALSVIGDQLRLAGLGRVDLSLLSARPVTFDGAPVLGCEGGLADVGTGACVAPATANADAITVRYQRIDGSLASATDCNGRAVPVARGIAENAFYVTGNTLMCRGSDGATMAASRAEPILENVQDLQLSYGVAQDADSANVTQYQPASALAAADWSRVVSVRVCLLVADPSPVNADVATTYRDCADNVQNIADGRLRRRFTSSFALRNRVG
ncbi:PilW family protein [Cupriavidus consociatus]|uniref:PilW family protein n=1 Tax=Cupriavidus consociatus TaxID=2821357 RepID=UPI001AE9F526|nr:MULTISPECIES: PilW family protein [unclassified Cupriavidus]MBP0621714.1 PilW family protein [Cupriavidus sp. LEh25]MDK2658389.1 PilW family protein [Cupriavidus sp. LEh21]